MTHVTEITNSHQQQLEAARLELERAVEISHQRVSSPHLEIKSLTREFVHHT